MIDKEDIQQGGIMRKKSEKYLGKCPKCGEKKQVITSDKKDYQMLVHWLGRHQCLGTNKEPTSLISIN